MAEQGGALFLQPGELFATDAPMRVKTVVGSCLAIVMRAPGVGFSAMAHCLLPEAGAKVDLLPREQALRYVDSTIEIMLRASAWHGAAPRDLEIKVFGGADSLDFGASGYHVGAWNIAAARSAFASRGLGIAACDLGGAHGRVIEFDSVSGDVYVKSLPAQPQVSALGRS